MTDLISKLFFLHSILCREVNAAFKQDGHPWRFEHFIFLSAIPPSKGIPLKDISATVFGNEQPSLRRVLPPLERAKLIKLKREATDRRHLRVHITTVGLDVFATLQRLTSDSIARVLPMAEPEMLPSVTGLLDRLLLNTEPESSEVA